VLFLTFVLIKENAAVASVQLNTPSFYSTIKKIASHSGQSILTQHNTTSWFWEGCHWLPSNQLSFALRKMSHSKWHSCWQLPSLKRVGYLQALSVASSCLEFAPVVVKFFSHLRLGCVPKVPTNVPNVAL